MIYLLSCWVFYLLNLNTILNHDTVEDAWSHKEIPNIAEDGLELQDIIQ